jgi:hypothetical protein
MIPFTRKGNSLRFPGANKTDRLDLFKGTRQRFLVIRSTGQLTCTAANNIPANFKYGDELGLLKLLTVITENTQAVIQLRGLALLMVLMHRLGFWPKMTTSFGDGVTANPSWDISLPIPYWLIGAMLPDDSIFDARGLSGHRLEVQHGTFTDINSAATGFTTDPFLETFTEEMEVDTQFNPLVDQRIVEFQYDIPAANSALQLKLPTGRFSYAGFLLNPTTAAGLDSATLITNVKLASQGRVVRDWDTRALYDSSHIHRGTPFGIFTTVNAAVTALVHAVGTADGTVDDVGGTFNQTTLNNNFKEITTELTKIRLALNGRPYQSQPRVSTDNNILAWYNLWLLTQGKIGEAVPADLDELILEVNASGAGKLNVIATELHPARRVAAA